MVAFVGQSSRLQLPRCRLDTPLCTPYLSGPLMFIAPNYDYYGFHWPIKIGYTSVLTCSMGLAYSWKPLNGPEDAIHQAIRLGKEDT